MYVGLHDGAVISYFGRKISAYFEFVLNFCSRQCKGLVGRVLRRSCMLDEGSGPICMLCTTPLEFMTTIEREAHVNGCLDQSKANTNDRATLGPGLTMPTGSNTGTGTATHRASTRHRKILVCFTRCRYFFFNDRVVVIQDPLDADAFESPSPPHAHTHGTRRSTARALTTASATTSVLFPHRLVLFEPFLSLPPLSFLIPPNA